MKIASAFLLLLASTAAAADPSARFRDITATAGIDTVYQGDWQYMVGGGVAVFDCDADGFQDVFVAGGEGPSGVYRNTSTQAGKIKFEKPANGLDVKAATGAYPLDIDSDGNTDLVILRVGENIVMRGTGNCQFERANETWGFDGGDGWSTAFAATWEKGNAWPTLAIGNYIDRAQELEPWGSCTDNLLHRPAEGQSSFTKPVALKPSFCTLGMMFSDWNKSGVPSLRVTNDREYYEGGQEQMWRIEPGKAPALYNEKDGWPYLRIWGMGVASYDLDFDGYPEYALTSMADQKLQTLDIAASQAGARPVFKDIAFAKGVTAHRPYQGTDLKPSTGWHTQFEDVNNDGLVDLFIAKGNVDAMPDFAAADPNNLLLQKPDGKFFESGGAAGISNNGKSRGGALADFNLDGLVDLLVVNRRTAVQVWQNVTPQAGNWIHLMPLQQGANRNAIGGWIEVKNQGRIMRRELTSGGGHVSGQLGSIHFGLGNETDAEIRIVWPDGEVGPWETVSGNTLYELKRGEKASAWSRK
jgi:enediyne biosynthesis protein E4